MLPWQCSRGRWGEAPDSSREVSTIEYPRSLTLSGPAAVAGPLRADLSVLSKPWFTMLFPDKIWELPRPGRGQKSTEALWPFCCVFPDCLGPDPDPTDGCERLTLWTGLAREPGTPQDSSAATTRLTCGFVLQLGLLQALPALYLDHLQVLTLLLRAGCPAALRTKQTEMSASSTDLRSRGQTGASQG